MVELRVTSNGQSFRLSESYQQACTAADLMLMSLGNTELLAQRCRESTIGQQRPNSLWVHVSALDQLAPLLRLYEGCASRTIGRPDEATAVKFHLHKPKITYLFYPDFDKDPHPALHTSMGIGLRDLHVRYRDYDPDNPPLLHQKEQLLLPDYSDSQYRTKTLKIGGREGLIEITTKSTNPHGTDYPTQRKIATPPRLAWGETTLCRHVHDGLV